MNITELEILKELYNEAIGKFKESPLYAQQKIEIKQELIEGITKEIINNQGEILKDGLKGATLLAFQEIYGHTIRDNIAKIAYNVKKREFEEPSDIKNVKPDEIEEINNYLYWLVRIRIIESKLKEYGLRPDIDVNGNITFIPKQRE